MMMTGLEIYRALIDLEAQNEAAALCTIIKDKGSTPRRSGSKMLVYADGRILGTIGGGEMESRVVVEAAQSIQDGRPRILEYNFSDPQRGDPGVCGGQVEVFVEPVLPRPVMVVVGMGHVGKAVAHLAHWLGFRVVASDDRPEFCTPEAIPDADILISAPVSGLVEQLKITPWTYLVLTTRSLDIDVTGLPALLESPAAYIGVIGSRRRWAITRNKLLGAGVPMEKVARVRSPIGLNLGAETPEEIAVSILAEIIQLKQGMGDSSSLEEQPSDRKSGSES